MSRQQADGWRHRNESRLFDTTRGRRALQLSQAIASLALLVLFWLAAGIPGVLSGVATVAVWYALGAPYAIAAGTVGLVVTAPTGQATLPLAGGAFLAVLLASALAAPEPGRYALGVSLGAAVFGVGTWVLVQTTVLWLATAVLLAGSAVTAYGLYRFHLLQLGLLDDTDDTARDVPQPRGRQKQATDGTDGTTTSEKTDDDTEDAS